MRGFDTMKKTVLSVCTLALASLVFGAPPAIPDTPAAVDEVVYLRPFTLSNGFAFDWCKERPQVTSGTLLVLKVDPALVVPRQVAEPVLYVGQQTAQRINSGHESGHVIALVPGEVDLSKALVWFGTPDLPERVDAAKISEELALAQEAGIKAFSANQIESAVAKGGDRLNVSDLDALFRGEVSELILKYSPQEKDLAEAFRVPVVGTQ
jgi:hypothetical protein